MAKPKEKEKMHGNPHKGASWMDADFWRLVPPPKASASASEKAKAWTLLGRFYTSAAFRADQPFKEGCMKRILWGVALYVSMNRAAFAEGETPVIDQRQANQERRIDQGLVTGQLNQREANRLEQSSIGSIGWKTTPKGTAW